jgi:FkbM family methyltransferase
MHAIEKTVFAIRHNKYLDRADALWDLLRPLYDHLSARAGRAGLERIINGTDRVLISTRCRSITEIYEGDVWRSIMAEVRVGDVVADVGAFIGLYTVALANRVGTTGELFSFEPDVCNFEMLREHVKLNHLDEQVTLISGAVGSFDGQLNLTSNGSESHVSVNSDVNGDGNGSHTVTCHTLDKVFANRRLDVMKIDVEGYEEMVLRGAAGLLADSARRPRAIFIEVHPYAWPPIGTTSESLLNLLETNGYRVVDLANNSLDKIDEYGEVVARTA